MAKAIMGVTVFSILLAFFGCQTTKAPVVIPYPKMDTVETVFFNKFTGEIVKDYPRCELVRSIYAIGLGYFFGDLDCNQTSENREGRQKAVTLYDSYNSTTNCLNSGAARDVFCKCCEDLQLKGEVLKRFNQFKGLSVKPFYYTTN